jgi:hypothetical protein
MRFLVATEFCGNSCLGLDCSASHNPEVNAIVLSFLALVNWSAAFRGAQLGGKVARFTLTNPPP